MAPDADATAGPPQGWHDLEAVLAEEPVARLLAAYLGPGAAARPQLGQPGHGHERRADRQHADAAPRRHLPRERGGARHGGPAPLARHAALPAGAAGGWP